MKIFCFKLNFIVALFCVTLSSEATEISPLIGLGTDNFAFALKSLSGNTQDINYAPNIPGLLRVGISALGYGVSYSFRGDAKDTDTTKGKTDFSDFQLGYHNKDWGVDGFYQTYKGFYNSNSENFGGSSIAPFLFSDLEFNHYGLSGRLAKDNQGGFNLSSLLSQSEQIKNTAGTYYLLGSIHYFSLVNPLTILPASLSGLNKDIDGLRKMTVHTANLGVGAGKYWLSKSTNLFFGANLDLLGTFGIYKYTRSPENTSTSSYGTTSFNLKIGTGYSGENFRIGVSYNQEVSTLKVAASTFLTASSNQVMAYFRVAF